MIRPSIRRLLKHYGEPIIALCVIVAGVWVGVWGGWFFAALGVLVALTGSALLIGALRRLPFYRDIAAAGVVELDEGALRFLTPTQSGGEVALADLTEIKLLRLQGQGFWRLRSIDGEALLIPVDAAGSERLANAFASLPDLDMGKVASALANFDRLNTDIYIVWRKQDGAP